MPAIIRKEHRKSAPRDDWETPEALFSALDTYFGFDLDPCASSKNAKCDRYITKAMDGLHQSWSDIGSCAFVNPPYTRGVVALWLRKARRERDKKVTSAVLLPCDPSTEWWWDHVTSADEVWYLKGRVKFVGGPSSPNFSSVIVVYRPENYKSGTQIVRYWDWRNDVFTCAAAPRPRKSR